MEAKLLILPASFEEIEKVGVDVGLDPSVVWLVQRRNNLLGAFDIPVWRSVAGSGWTCGIA